MLTKRRVGETVWALWRGSFLRYSSLGEEDYIDHRDQWACSRVEATGLDPTVLPGKAEYLRLCDVNHETLRKIASMTNEYRLFWTPPLMRPDEDLATILNGLVGTFVTPEDAALQMASYNEVIELKAEMTGLKLVRCAVPAFNMLACLNALGGISVTNIQRCLSVYAANSPEELHVS